MKRPSGDMAARVDTTRAKHRIAAIWDSRADAYDPLFGHELRSAREQDAWLSLLARLLPSGRPLRVLDIGVGTAFLARLISLLGHHVTGLDFSERMLAVARNKARRDTRSIDFVMGDAERLPFAEQSFDAVISRAVLWTLLDPGKAVSQWSRVVRTEGTIIAIDGLWHEGNRTARLVGKWLERLQSRGRSQTVSYPQEICKRLPLRKIVTAEHARSVFVAAGLCDVRSEQLGWIDSIERESMSLTERLTYRYRRYLVAAHR